MTIDLLRAIEKKSDLRFQIKIMSYKRAKLELQQEHYDVIGHTPYQSEEQEFYRYAQELSWNVPTAVDLFSMRWDYLEPSQFRLVYPIGTPRGNDGFFAALYGIPVTHFYSYGDLPSLLKMMAIGHIKVFLFERAATITQLRQLKIKGAVYRHIDTLGASLAVQNNAAGTALRRQLDNLIELIDTAALFAPYHQFAKMSEEGAIDLQAIPAEKSSP